MSWDILGLFRQGCCSTLYVTVLGCPVMSWDCLDEDGIVVHSV